MSQILQTQFLGKPVSHYATILVILVGGLIVAQILKKLVLRSKKRIAQNDDGSAPAEAVIERVARSLVLPLVYLGSLYAAVRVLNVEGAAGKIIDTAFLVALIWYIVRFGIITIRIVLGRYFEKTGQVEAQQRLRPLMAFINLILWLIGAIFLLDNLGFKISSIVTGLGIGGIAVALAGQAVLGDLFSYFVILFDRPFELGDFVITGDILGTIEAIGIKTTKIRSLSGEQIVISNSNLTGSKLRNYKRMERRRVVFSLGVTYDTGKDKLQLIPGIIRDAIESADLTAFDRAHFKEFGDFSLNFEAVYYVLSADYNIYMDIQQAINLTVYERFEQEGIEFAFPTRTIQLDPPIRESFPERQKEN